MLRYLNLLVLIMLSTPLFAQTIVITSPNGGEVWQGCTTQNITWNASGTSQFYSIDYSTDNGSSWTSIATFYNSVNGVYSWDVPNIQSTQALIRVQDSNNNLVQDISNLTFSMAAPLILSSPNGGEIIEGGTTHAITWVASNTSNYYSLEYSLDGGNSWTYIDDYFYNTNGIFYWNVPNTPSAAALVKIADYNENCKQDQSNQLFEISPATALINVTQPNANQTLFHNESFNIQWSSQFVNSNQVQIDYSLDGGNTWNIIASITENDGSFPWIVPTVLSSSAMIRVTDLTNPATFDTSEPYFNIAEPFINITAPNGGEVEVQCEAITINWTHGGTHPNERFTILYSTDNGANWNTVVTNLSQGNDAASSYTWQVASPEGPCLIQVRDYYNPALFDVSDAEFNITPNTDMIVTAPNGGEVLEVGSSYEITWADNNITYCGIYYSVDNGANWIEIDYYDNSDGSRFWTVPNSPTNQGLMRIWDYQENCRVDYSDTPFTIVQPAPSLTYPNGGQDFYQYQTINISWTSSYFNTNFVHLEYTLDEGETWTSITTAASNNGSYSWLIPAVQSQAALIRVSAFDNPTIFDVSDEPFSISEAIVITSPNGDNGVQDWRVCTETTITWTSGGTSNYFEIYYSLNNGLTWIALETNYYSPGFNNTYDWVMPNSPGPGALVRVEDRFNSNQVDYSDNTFTIAPAITIISPNGGEVLGAGDVLSINWLNEGASNFYDIDYSINGGSTWNNIVFNQFIGGSSYDWILPAALSSNYRIRVRDHVNNCKEDYSDGLFEVGAQTAAQIALSNPTGGETFAACENLIVTWNSVGTSDYFNLDYSLDGGLTWINIVENHFTLSGTYSWAVPNSYSNNLVLRVMDAQAAAYNNQTSIPMAIIPAQANAGEDRIICLGESVFLQASGGVSYAWSPSLGLDNPTSDAPLASPSTSTTYTLSITDENGCEASDQVLVTVNTDCEIAGCMDETAYNYNPLATTDSGFCLYTEGNGGGNNSVCPSDFNNDGITNLADLLIFLNNIGTICN